MNYIKEGIIIKEADLFTYSEEIYLSYPNRWELYRSKTYVSKTPLSNKNSSAYSAKQKCHVYRTWELIGAPKEFLIKEGFTPDI